MNIKQQGLAARRATQPPLPPLTEIGDEPQLIAPPSPAAPARSSEAPRAEPQDAQVQDTSSIPATSAAQADQAQAAPKRRGRPPKIRTPEIESAGPSASPTQRVSLILPADLHQRLKLAAAKKTLESVTAGGRAVAVNDLIVDAVRRIL